MNRARPALVATRVTVVEKHLIQAVADQLGVSVSELVYRSLMTLVRAELSDGYCQLELESRGLGR